VGAGRRNINLIFLMGKVCYKDWKIKDNYFIFVTIKTLYNKLMKRYPIRCPVTAYLSVIDGHWKPLLLWHLQTKPLRFKDILSRIPDISTRVLTEQLNEMEEDKLISRKAYNETPPRVEYKLTEYGRTLLPGLAMLREWGLQFLKKNKHVLHPDSEWNQKIIELL
jgi:DNA-binding HxlR family transcriptional regulator